MAALLTPQIPGDIQVFGIFLLNSAFLLMLLYTTYQKYYESKVKVIFKLIFNGGVVVIDFALFALRRTYELGEAMKIIALAATVPLIIEAIVKVGEMIYNLVKIGIQKKKEQEEAKKNNEAIEEELGVTKIEKKDNIPED